MEMTVEDTTLVRKTRGRTRIVGSGLIKGDIPRNPHPPSNRVIAAIALVFGTVPKKNTLNRLSSEFGALSRWK
jgi:transcription antitermination factor NusG